MSKVDEVAIAQAVGKNISKKRVACGLTQENVAERLEIGLEAVSRIERGTVTPNIVRLCEFADIFECKVEDLITGASSRKLDQANYIVDLIGKLSDSNRKMIVEVVEKIASQMQKKK